jgi:hypothetical protein
MAVSMLHVYVYDHVACLCACACCMYIYIEMPGKARYRTKLTQSGIFLVWYRTKILDAGMPKPALVSSMPMPSYAWACNIG